MIKMLGGSEEHPKFVHFNVTCLHPISNIGSCASIFVVFRYIVRRGCVGCQRGVKCAVKCHLVLLVDLILLGAWHKFQDVRI